MGGRDLTQNEFDALVALSFNVGRSKFNGIRFIPDSSEE